MLFKRPINVTRQYVLTIYPSLNLCLNLTRWSILNSKENDFGVQILSKVKKFCLIGMGTKRLFLSNWDLISRPKIDFKQTHNFSKMLKKNISQMTLEKLSSTSNEILGPFLIVVRLLGFISYVVNTFIFIPFSGG